MSKTIHIISDLHLCDSQPHLTHLFEQFMTKIAPASQQLYILGDFFEVWIGDDFSNDLSEKVCALLKNYSDQGGELFLMHGNRDFLIGQEFSLKCGAKLIDEPYPLHWHNKDIFLMHGDILCTDDTAYQEFRKMVREEKWQRQFLSASIGQRLEIAADIRQQSKDAQKAKQTEIMDVNQTAVSQFFQENRCDWLIHGHTHREGKSEIALDNGNKVARIVLSDWGEEGHYLELKGGVCTSHYFD